MGHGSPLCTQLLPPLGAANCAMSRRPVLHHPLRGRCDPRGPAIHDLVWSCSGPLGKEIRDVIPGAMQAWYANDCGMSGEMTQVVEAMTLLERLGPARGYYPEPAKSIIICTPVDMAGCRQGSPQPL